MKVGVQPFSVNNCFGIFFSGVLCRFIMGAVQWK